MATYLKVKLDQAAEFAFVWGALLALGSLLIVAKLCDKVFRCEIEDEDDIGA